MPIQLGIRAHDLKPESLEDLISVAKQYQLSNFQFAPTKLPGIVTKGQQLTPGFAEYVATHLKAEKLSISVLGCYIAMIHPDPIVREAELTKFEQYLTLATWFGHPIVATETGSVIGNGYDLNNYTEFAFQAVVQSVKRLAKCAEKCGATIAIEAGINHPIHDLTTTVRLFEAVNSPNLKLIFDLSNLLTPDNLVHQEEIVTSFLTTFKDKIVSFHLKDVQLKEDQLTIVPFGTGQVNHSFLLKTINENFPYTFATLESIDLANLNAAIQLIHRNVTIVN